MNLVRNIDGYQISENYELLWDLAQKHSVICEVDLEDGKDGIRDIASTLFKEFKKADGHSSDMIEMSVGVRGYCYITAFGKDQFLDACNRSNLKWLLPTEKNPLKAIKEMRHIWDEPAPHTCDICDQEMNNPGTCRRCQE